MPINSYTVKQGDTLSNIAKNYNVDMKSITGYASGDPNKIGVGETLSINTPDLQPVNKINAADLGQPALVNPEVPTRTKALSLQSLAESTSEKISSLEGTVAKGEKDINRVYSKLGSQATKRVEAYASEQTPFGTVNETQKELVDINNMIRRKTLEYNRSVERIQEENPTGKLTEGQKIDRDKLDREWARTAADLSIVAEAKLGNFNAAKGIIDDKIDAETEDLTTRLSQLTMFYNQNYNRLTELQRTKLEQETTIVKDELETVRAREEQIGALQLEAVRNGADVNTVLAIGKAKNVEEAMVKAGGYLQKKTSGTGSDFFSKTQVSKGASAAGMTIDEFNTLDEDTQNFFINSYADATTLIEDAFKSGETLESIQADLASANIPEQALSKLNEYAATMWDSNYRPLSQEEKYQDIVNALSGYKDQNYSRSEAFDAEYQFQTTDSKGNSLNLPSSQLKQIKSDIKDAQAQVYGRTIWQKIIPGGR